MTIFKSPLAALAGVAMLAAAGTAYADPEGPFLGTDIGVSFAEGLPSRFSTDAGIRFDITPGYRIYSDDAFEVSLMFDTGVIWNSFSAQNGFGKFNGDMYQVPILGGFEYAFHVGDHIVPYIGIEGGGVYNDREYAGGSQGDFVGAIGADAGVRFRLNPNIDLGIGYKFLATFGPDSSTICNHTALLSFVWHF
jgi:opacity protein-like surface antigen